MNNKFFYLYLIGGSLALILFIYQLFSTHNTPINVWNLLGNVVLTLLLYYMAYKTYHEKKDRELM